jgi:hypothetical protein
MPGGMKTFIRPKHVEKRNNHTKKNCAPSWLYLPDYTGMHGQQNIKKTLSNWRKFKTRQRVSVQ